MMVTGGEAAAEVSTEPYLVRDAAGAIYVVEGTTRRSIRSGILAAAVEVALGTPQDVSAEVLSGWREGVPIEVHVVPPGPPFVVIGGTKRPIRGLPEIHRVRPSDLEAIPAGRQLDVAAANVSRARFERAMEHSRSRDGRRARVVRLGRRVRGRVRRVATRSAVGTTVPDPGGE